MVIAIILEYSTSCVQYAKLPQELDLTTESVETYLQEELAFHLDEISYMLVNDSCPIYDVTEDDNNTAGNPVFIIQ